MMVKTLYDTIGKTYDFTRRADLEITKRLIHHLSPKKNEVYLDVGCGSGNYTRAIIEEGFNIFGLDISKEMLGKAKTKYPTMKWICGDVKSMPIQNDSFNGVTCILATHHFLDLGLAFQDVFRIMKGGNFVIFTSSPEQMAGYWLNRYFPKMMQKARSFMPTFEKTFLALKQAGFQHIKVDPFFVPNGIQDLFLYSGKYQPQIYLDPVVRAGISSFALEENEIEITQGCEKLRQDIISEHIHEIISSYENISGDYAFIVCSK